MYINHNHLETLDGLMEKSYVVFALNHMAGYRMTEIRIWSCERSEDDIKMMMYEYLQAAETKKKFRVKIKNKRGAGAATKGASLARPKAGGLAPPKGMLAPPKKVVAAMKSAKLTLAPPKDHRQTTQSARASTPALAQKAEPTFRETSEFESFGTFGRAALDQTQFSEANVGGAGFGGEAVDESQGYDDDAGAVTLWDTAVPLSQQIRSSAAGALIRGPPATRHFGGNRGGLPDFGEVERFGVGGIAICGSEKTIVWRDDQEPPALTYPIGASGAVVSDQLGEDGSEFLCCFLAKDKRMVVFELQSRTVVVELQMTTKLNFWRFLPPEACENTLCFLLITPVGGFHWMPLDESPRPFQVWKRGPDLQGKKIVGYEEGGFNGMDGPDMRSAAGLIMVTNPYIDGSLEAWVVPIAGDSQADLVSNDVLGACFCLPPYMEEVDAFFPLLIIAEQEEEGIVVSIVSLFEPEPGGVEIGEVETSVLIDDREYEDLEFEPPALAMGTYPEVICCSLANIAVVIVRRKGMIVACEVDEMEQGGLQLIAQENVGHFVIDAVMRYSVTEGGVEIVMLLADNDDPKDGRMVSFCFRAA